MMIQPKPRKKSKNLPDAPRVVPTVMPKKMTSTNHKKAPAHTRINTRSIKAQFVVQRPTKKVVAVLTDNKPVEKVVVEAVIEEPIVIEEPMVEESVEEESVEVLDLISMTKKQLIAIAQKEKVTYKNLSKADLLEALQILLN